MHLKRRPLRPQVRFKPAFNVGKISKTQNVTAGTVEVDCFPLHAILLALNVTRVDYFSLDVEGAELDVLNTVPFDRIDIRVGHGFEPQRWQFLSRFSTNT